MTIQIRDSGSLFDVRRKLRAFEALYQITSDRFAAGESLDVKVPEFDAIEWNFLLMQQSAMGEDGCGPTIFSANNASRTSVVDAREWHEDVAA